MKKIKNKNKIQETTKQAVLKKFTNSTFHLSCYWHVNARRDLSNGCVPFSLLLLLLEKQYLDFTGLNACENSPVRFQCLLSFSSYTCET